MRNVDNSMLKTCIFVEYDRYKAVLKQIFGDVKVTMSYDGIDVYDLAKENDISNEDICQKLAEYFDVPIVTSVHIDQCEYAGVWIVYRNDY